MEENNKLLEGLKSHVENDHGCSDCPYNNHINCIEPLLVDALKYVKSREEGDGHEAD